MTFGREDTKNEGEKGDIRYWEMINERRESSKSEWEERDLELQDSFLHKCVIQAMQQVRLQEQSLKAKKID